MSDGWRLPVPALKKALLRNRSELLAAEWGRQLYAQAVDVTGPSQIGAE